jgi:DNA-binding GntR family transcriptional regulator
MPFPTTSTPLGGTTETPTPGAFERVYSGLRHDIITGSLNQGSRLNEQRFAERYAVSRVPLREAFARLVAERLLVQEPRRSAVVSTWTRARVDALFDTRLAIEVAAAGYAARRIAAGASSAELRMELHDSEHDLAAGDALSLAESSSRFHLQIVDMTGNPLLSTLARTISHETTWLFHLTTRWEAQPSGVAHGELVDAIESGNEELARALAYTHIELGRAPSLRQFTV